MNRRMLDMTTVISKLLAASLPLNEAVREAT